MKRLNFEIAVVGAGPAGIAAAGSAARGNVSVVLIDDNPALGGQVWRGGPATIAGREASDWFVRTQTANITHISQAKVVAVLGTGDGIRDGNPDDGTALLVETGAETLHIHYRSLIIATGARERFLPFPGWTLPGVTGAGGLQALVKGGLPIAGKRVAVAGSGPLLLAVAAWLRKQGAQVICIVEQTPRRRLLKVGLSLPFHLRQGKQVLSTGWRLIGIPLYTGAWVRKATGSAKNGTAKNGTAKVGTAVGGTDSAGTEKLESVTIRTGKNERTVACDYLACGFGLIPNLELPAMLGLDLRNGAVQVDQWQHTSGKNIYCAGEAAGIGGLEPALLEGQLAGLAASGQREKAAALQPAVRRARRFAGVLAKAFMLRPELKELPDAETIVCRCEDVRYGQVSAYTSWRDAKLQTRCGMGPCQGRICGGATEVLFGWNGDSVRPPMVAARVASFMDIEE